MSVFVQYSVGKETKPVTRVVDGVKPMLAYIR